MVRRMRRLKKFAPHLIIMAVLTASIVPTLGMYLLNELNPYLNLTDVMAKPEAVILESMEIVDRSYDKDTVESVYSSSDEIVLKFPIWDVEGIYLAGEYAASSNPYNYFNQHVFINENTIDISNNPVRRAVANEQKQSQFVSVHENIFNISQSEDDAWNRYTTLPRTDFTSDTLLIGGSIGTANDAQRKIALRWNTTVPSDAILKEAYIYLTYSTSNNYNGMRLRIFGFNDGNTPDFSDTSENLWLRPRTTSLNWIAFQETHSFTDNETVQTVDIKGILQQVIDNPEWEGNYSFGVIIIPYQQVQTNEMIEFWSYDGAMTLGKLDFVPKLYVKWEESPATNYSQSDFIDPSITIERRLETTDYELKELLGVWNSSDHSQGNMYDESQGDSITGNDITTIVRTLFENETDVWVSYLTNEKVPVVVEYIIHEWTTVTWRLGLEFDNRGDETIIVPRANLTLNYLDENLGEGWISKEYEIKPNKKKMIDAYLVMENDRITNTFVTAVLLGEPIEFKMGFEAYILAEDSDGEPLLPVVYSIDLDFPFPSSSWGPPPFIHSITRSVVQADQPVKISVSASDEGTGISNRTYIYYSINGGYSWEQVEMIGGTWTNLYLGSELGGYYPIKSTLEPEIYEGEIPASANKAGREILFKVYLEDFADNIDHESRGNWVWSQTYSYLVPGAGVSPEFEQTFQQNTEASFFEKFLDYIDLNGLILSNFLYLRGITTDALIPLLPSMSEFFYNEHIDASYVLSMLLVHFDKGTSAMDDSGVSVGYLLKLFGISFEDIFTFLVDHAFLPVEEDIYPIAKQRFEEITIIDDLDGFILDYWNSTPTGIVTEEGTNILDLNGNIGSKSLNWSVSAPSTLCGNLSTNSTNLSKNDNLVFYIDYDKYARINGNLSITLVDNYGKIMASNNLTFSEVAPGVFQEINLNLNSDFKKDPGFNIYNITQINFTFSGNEAINIYLDYISAYSSQSYAIHNHITNTLKLRNMGGDKSIKDFLDNEFQGMGASLNPLAPAKDYIMPDWSQNNQRTSSWNFLNLMATNATYNYIDGPGPNHHMVAAELLLEYIGVPEPYRRICELLGIEIEEIDEPFTKEEIYPYTQKLTTLIVYIPLGAVASLAIIIKARNYRNKKLAEKISKLQKKGKVKGEMI